MPVRDTGGIRSACALVRANLAMAAVGSASVQLPASGELGAGGGEGTYLRAQAQSRCRVEVLVCGWWGALA